MIEGKAVNLGRGTTYDPAGGHSVGEKLGAVVQK